MAGSEFGLAQREGWTGKQATQESHRVGFKDSSYTERDKDIPATGSPFFLRSGRVFLQNQ